MPARALGIGILVADLVVPPLQRLPQPGARRHRRLPRCSRAGARRTARSPSGRLGVSVAVCGRVGDDPFGDFLESDLAARGIDTSLVGRAPGYPASKTVIVPVVGDDRRFVHSFGANAAVTAADIDLTALVTAGVVYVGGYLVLPSLRADELAERFAHARRRARRSCSTSSFHGRPGAFARRRARVLPLVDYFVPNEDEARARPARRSVGGQSFCSRAARARC